MAMAVVANISRVPPDRHTSLHPAKAKAKLQLSAPPNTRQSFTSQKHKPQKTIPILKTRNKRTRGAQEKPCTSTTQASGSGALGIILLACLASVFYPGLSMLQAPRTARGDGVQVKSIRSILLVS